MRSLAFYSLVTALPLAVMSTSALGDGTSGSVGCAAVVQSAEDGMVARINADAAQIQQPASVHSMGCLGGFFSGIGLNLVTSLFNPASLITALEGQVCSAIRNAWQQTVGSISCGLTLTGFNFGFGGFGGGLSCPRLSFGGGGPPIATVGLGMSGAGGGLYINGSGLAPTGYSTAGQPYGTF